VKSMEFSLSLPQNSDTCLQELKLGRHMRSEIFFFLKIQKLGFRSCSMRDVPPALWPHAIATVTGYPSLILHLLRPISGSLMLGEIERKRKKVTNFLDSHDTF
jgi:hypothetical protein